jgi:biotin transport system substrate-specific component
MPLQNATAQNLTSLDRAQNFAASVLAGLALMTILSRLSIPLGFTPVPITGQTLGVALCALMFGRARGVTAVAAYLALGAAGVPLFALGKAGLSFGPTTGYLIGMMAAALVMGSLADLGWTKSWGRTWLAAFIGSAITFGCGVFVLSFFLPRESLFVAGVLPFLPGDAVKTLIAATVARQWSQKT